VGGPADRISRETSPGAERAWGAETLAPFLCLVPLSGNPPKKPPISTDRPTGACQNRSMAPSTTETGNAERIVFTLHNESTGRDSKMAFTGRFIVGDLDDPEEFLFDHEKRHWRAHGGLYAVAVTASNNLAVLSVNDREVTEFKTYGSFQQFAAEDDRYPESLIHAVASELGVEHIEELNI